MKPSNPNHLLVASPGGGVFRSVNGGTTWTQPANVGLADDTVVHLAYDLQNSTRVLALTRSGVYSSTDDAASWTAHVGFGGSPTPIAPQDHEVEDPMPFGQLSTGGGNRVVFAGFSCGGIWYTYDLTIWWQTFPFPGGLSNPDNCIGTLAVDPSRRRVYVGSLQFPPVGEAPRIRRSCVWMSGTPCTTWEDADGGPLPTGDVPASMASAGSLGVVAQFEVSSTAEKPVGRRARAGPARHLSTAMRRCVPCSIAAATASTSSSPAIVMPTGPTT